MPRKPNLDQSLTWLEVGRVAEGGELEIGFAAAKRLDHAREIVDAVVDRGIRAYGITTGVGALSDTIVNREAQAQLSRNIIFSHACGTGPLLPAPEVRAIIAAQINNFSHGYSGVRRKVVEALNALLIHDCIPDVPSRGSAGYLVHMAHIALVLIGEGRATLEGHSLTGAEALRRLGLEPLVLQAKEGLSLVNGTSCSCGLGSYALLRARRIADWADAIAAMTLEALGGQISAFDPEILELRVSPGLQYVGHSLRRRLAGSKLIDEARGRRTQDALSLRAIPHAHGAARDVFDHAATVVNRELASVTDNPIVFGTIDDPHVASEAHAVAPAMALAMDNLGTAFAQLSMLSERRLDRLVNPLVSGLPAFLAPDPGAGSGLMIAQYTAAALTAENRRLGTPASLDGGITSAMQEDFLTHPTAAANKLLAVLDNVEQILAIELAAAVQADDFLSVPGDPAASRRAPGTEVVYQLVRREIPSYGDDRPLSDDLSALCQLIRMSSPPAAPELN
jgi:histidine ammonia-lyase